MRADADLSAAFNAACQPDGDTRPISKIIPRLLKDNDAGHAHALVCHTARGKDRWLPEALTLFNIAALSKAQRNEMLRTLFPVSSLSAETAALWADCNARIGRLGFSFPQWRFLAQGFEGGSLLERFGMKRLERPNDIRHPALPPGDPDRDEYGTGFVWQDGVNRVELRRAYILCSGETGTGPLTITIRNNSYFFGRDRLREPAYLSFKTLSNTEIDNLDDNSLSRSRTFMRWQDVSDHEKFGTVRNLLDRIDNFNTCLGLWLASQTGQQHLTAYTQQALEKQARTGKTEPPFYIAGAESFMPVWFPADSVAAITPLPAKILQHRKIILLSGAQGDFPVPSP